MQRFLKILIQLTAFGFAAVTLITAATQFLPASLFVESDVLLGNQIFRVAVFPAGILALTVFLFSKSWTLSAVTALASLVLYIDSVQPAIGHAEKTIRTNSGHTITVMTFNAAGRSFRSAFDFIQDHPVDVLCLQELPTRRGENTFEKFAELGYQYDWRWLRKERPARIAVLVKGQILNTEMINTLSEGGIDRRALSIEAMIKGIQCRIICLHLEPQLYNGETPGIFNRARHRCIQAEQISEYIASKSDRYLIVAGDFNSTPTNRSLRPIRKSLTDSWTEAGGGLGGTWKRGRPYFRIDAILYNGFSGAYNAARLPIGDSDHLGYRVELEL